MKKTFLYIVCALGAAMAFSSCDIAQVEPDPNAKSFLDTESPSTSDAANIFSDYTLAEYAVKGIWECFAWQNSYRGRFHTYYGTNTDIEWYNEYDPTSAKYKASGYNLDKSNSELDKSDGPFPKIYEGIEKANLCIEGLKKYGNVETNAEMGFLYGESLTLRAMLYYDLVKAWGDVPARFHSTTPETIYVPKSDRDVIYLQLLADLDEAATYLPWPNGNNATQFTYRVNKAFAKGLYARTALAAAGYSLRPDEGKVGTGNAGTIRKSTNPALQAGVLYPKALAHLKDIIESGSCKLEDFETYWRKFNNQENITAGGETIFVIPFGDNRGRWNFTFAIKSEDAEILGSVIKRGGDCGPVPTMYFDYDAKDVRRDISCVNFKWSGDAGNEAIPAGIGTWYFGKYRYEWMTAHPYGGGNDDGIKPVVLRYADVLLMAAEIENYLNGPANAKPWLLQVRKRAFKGNEDMAEDYVNALSSKEDFQKAIVDERALEFCGEMLRKSDLIRWNLLKSKMDETKSKMYALRTRGVDPVTGKDYSTINSTVWWQYDAAAKICRFYGFNEGETSAPAGAWEVEEGYATKYVDDSSDTRDKKPKKSSGLHSLKIEGLYYNDPDKNQFWPIFSTSINDSQGTLVNDYGY